MRILLAALLVALPAQAAKTEERDVMCEKGWCAIKQDTLKSLLEGAQKLDEHNRYLRTLCGWDRP